MHLRGRISVATTTRIFDCLTTTIRFTKRALFNVLLGRCESAKYHPLETGVLTRCVEDYLGRHVGVRAKRDLLHNPAERKRERRERNREEEHGLQSVTEGMDDEGSFGDRQSTDLCGINRDASTLHEMAELYRRQGRTQLVQQSIVEDVAQYGDAEGATNRPEERRGSSGGAQL